jgi:CO/xanthine dehydrogenase FAD-binding subunit
MSLPAGPMIALTAALDGVCTIWKADGSERKISVADFVTGDQSNVLAPGDLLRQIDIPLTALKRRSAFRQISLTPVGRSAVLLIGSVTGAGAMALTVTASTTRPVQLSFPEIPAASELREAILHRIPDALYHDDVHGKPAWRKHMTLRLAQEIRAELQGAAPP